MQKTISEYFVLVTWLLWLSIVIYSQCCCAATSGIKSANVDTTLVLTESSQLVGTDKPTESTSRIHKSRKSFTFCPGYLHGNTQSKLVALTFDDGPSPYTLQILDVLAAERVPGTFFVIGLNVLKHPDILRRIYHAGHIVGNHTYKHLNLAKLDNQAASAALLKTNELIYQHLGVYPRLYRSPYGSCNLPAMQAARDLGLISVNWSSAADDYHVQRTSPERIAAEILAFVRPGAIIDLHDGGGDRHKTVAAVQLIIQKLKAEGYRFVSLADLIQQAPYYTDSQWQALRKQQRSLQPNNIYNTMSTLAANKRLKAAAHSENYTRGLTKTITNTATNTATRTKTTISREQLRAIAYRIAQVLEQGIAQENE